MNAPATELYPLSLHDALPICLAAAGAGAATGAIATVGALAGLRVSANQPTAASPAAARSEEHTSELQSHSDLVCRLLLEKKKRHAGAPGRARRGREHVEPERH